MIKRTLGLLAASFLLAGTASASVVKNGEVTCFPLEHGENGQGSRASVIIPPFFLHGTSEIQLWTSNIGPDPVNVSLKLFDENGNQWQPVTAPTYRGKFSASNTPIRQIGGSEVGLLSSFNAGHVLMTNPTESRILTGILTWQANKCIEGPTLAANVSVYRHFPEQSTRDSVRSITVNGGKPF